ncbi:armadillo-type protein [Pilaira anomala]|nr:armadillo-type protein [Pilaira anomala]
MFKQLQDQYPKLLLLVTSGIRSSEGALRCACIEACKLFIHCPEGYAWLLHNKQATSFITFALLDQSNYVVAEACQLFSTLLKVNAHSLLEAMDPSSLILSILHPDCDEKQIISALDFCWEIVNLHPVMQLLCSTNRIIRSRVLEIISILFAWDTDPLNSLDLKDTATASTIDLAYQKISFISNTMIAQALKMEDLMTGVSLLDTSLILLQRSSIQNQLPLNILFSLFDSCVSDKPNEEYKNIKRLLVTNRNKNNLMQAILKIMDKLISVYPKIITEDPRFVQVFDILDNSLFYSDGRVLKSCLTLLLTSLQHYEQPELLNKSIHSLINMLEQSDFKNLVIILESFDHLVGHDKIGTLLTEFSVCQTFVNELNNKLFDTEWNIRDVVINFVGNLFKEPYSKTRIKFGLNFDLPLQVFDRIQDTEPYVRASALQVLSSMIKHDEGWCYIQRHEQSKTLLKKLPSLLHDSEAFVRRAGLDTIICLAQYRLCQGINMEMGQSEDSLR